MYSTSASYYRILCFITILFCSTFSWATDQIPELFIYQHHRFCYNGLTGFGEEYPLYPLTKYEGYQEKMNMRSNGELMVGCRSTACYRGYQGIWKIEDNTLFLSELKDGCYDNTDVVNMEEVFDEIYTEHGVKAFWITDTIFLTDQPVSSFTITNRFSYLILIVQEGHIAKIIEEGPFFDPEPEYIEDKYKLASNQLPELFFDGNEQFYAKGEWDPLYELIADEAYVSRMDTNEYGGLQLSSCYSSGCERSYQGMWEISNDTLYLREVQDFCTQASIFDLEKIFGKAAVTPKGVRAFWIDQVLIISSKEINEFELKKKGNLPTYLKLTIEKGVLIKKEREEGE